MAIDTRAKRQHVAGLHVASRNLLPHPDSTVDTIDRHYFGWAYIEADAPAVDVFVAGIKDGWNVPEFVSLWNTPSVPKVWNLPDQETVWNLE